MLRKLLVKPKDPLSKENVVGTLYKIKCEECEAVHVGETERSLTARFDDIGDLALPLQRLQNTSTLIIPNIPWS